MKRLFLFLSIIWIALQITGCKPEPYIIVEQSDFDFDEYGGKGVVSFKSNYYWEIKSNDAWITVTTTQGVASDDNEVEFSVVQNRTFGQREGSFSIYSDSKKLNHKITIHQSQNDTLLINHDTYTIPSEGGVIPVNVVSNIDFLLDIQCDWITRTKALSSNTLYFEVNANPDIYTTREAKIIIQSTSAQYVKEITVIQTQEDYFSISSHGFTLPTEGGSVEVDVVTNIDYQVYIPAEFTSWIKENTQSTKALKGYHHTFEISRNVDDSWREAYILFVGTSSAFRDSVIITQDQTNHLTLANSYFQLDSKEQTIDVSVNSNVPVSYSILGEARSWLSIVSPKAISATDYTFKVSHFEGSDTEVFRTGMVEFFNSEKAVSDTLTVVQTADGVYYVKLAAAGTLQNYFDVSEYNSVKKIIVSGEVRDNDIYFIRDNLINVELIDFSQLSNTSLPYGSFSNDGVGMEKLKRMVLPSRLNTINHYAFNNCINLSEVVFPETLVTIRQYTFSGCSSLKVVSLPSNVRTIDSYAFYNSGIVSINIPQNVSVISQSTFKGCLSLTSVVFDGSVRSIGTDAFNGSGLKSISIPSGVTIIGSNAFYDCKSLVSVSIPNSVYSIGGAAFAYCTALTSIEIPSAVTVIDNNLIRGCTSLTTFTIPAQITRIDYNALMDCSGMKVLICNATTPPQLVSDPFMGINKETCILKVPSESVDIYKATTQWQTFVNIEAK